MVFYYLCFMKNLKNIVADPFNDLSFDEKNHRYFVKGEPLKCSVSKLIEDFYEKFDSQSVSARVAQQQGRTQKEVLDDWKAINIESTTRGHRVHLFGELYQFNRNIRPSCPQELAITKFWKDMPEHILPVTAELRMYHFKHLFAGTADVLLFDTKNQTYIIADYKTNKDLNKNFRNKTMLAPFNNFLDSPLNHYQIQLSYYQILLEQIGVKVSRRIIVWLDLEGNYQMIDTEDLTDKLKEILN